MDFRKQLLDHIRNNPGITEKELITSMKSTRGKVRYHLTRCIGMRLIKKDPPVKSGGIMYYYPVSSNV